MSSSVLYSFGIAARFVMYIHNVCNISMLGICKFHKFHHVNYAKILVQQSS